jgi:WD40 repeat protein
VDARGAKGVLAGPNGTQFNYFITGTSTNEISARPLISVSGTIVSPYRGLDAFGEGDAGLFFGRETAIAEVLDRMSRLERPGLLVISGVSGAGKSSLIGAGVLPRLRAAGLAGAAEASAWPRVVFTPDRAPLQELAVRIAPLARVDAADLLGSLTADPARFALTAQAAALAEPGDAMPGSVAAGGAGQRRLLIVVDQCEQLFTRCESEQERKGFVTALHAAATLGNGGDRLPPAMVLLVVRADFEARLADFDECPGLTKAVQGRYLLTAMTDLQLRLAITQPAVAAGSSVDGELTKVLLADAHGQSTSAGTVGGGSGVLPLLSHALDEAWRNRAGHALTLTDYEQSGGIANAVATSAKRAYRRLTPPQRELARQVFLRLTAVGSDGTDTAARARRADLVAGRDESQVKDIEAVLETFAAERLLTMSAEAVQISHEALLTAWPLLRDTWLAETRSDRAIRSRLQATAEEWVNASRDPAYLYDGSRLEAARETADLIDADARQSPVGQVEREFLDASERAHRRRRRRLQGFIGLLAALVVGFASIAFVALHLRTEASQESDATRAGLLSVKSEITGDSDPALAKLMSIAAWRLSPSEQTRYAMMNAATLPGVTNLPGNSAQFSPDGKILAIGSDNNTLQLWNLATMQPMGAPIPGVEAFLFDPAGKTIAIESTSGTVRLWSIDTRQWIGKSFAHGGQLAAFSPSGSSLVLSMDYGKYLQSWNPLTGTPISGPFGEGLGQVVFSPNGKLLAVDSYAVVTGVVTFWSTTTWQQLGGAPISPCPAPASMSLAFSPDSNVLATGCGSTGNTISMGDGAVAFFDVATHKQIGSTITSVDARVGGISFSPDGETLAVSSLASNAVGEPGGGTFLFSVATHQQISQPLPGGGPVRDVTFSPDGRFLASEESGQIQLWDVGVATGLPASAPITVTGGVGRTAFSPDGKILAVSTNAGESDGTVWLYNTVGSMRVLRSIATTGGPIGSLAFSPDGKTLAVGTGTIGNNCAVAQLFDIATGLRISTFNMCGPNTFDTLVTFSPDGKILALSNGSATELLNVIDGKEIGSPLQYSLNVYELAFSPNGETLAIGGGSGASGGIIDLWNVATHKRVAHIVYPQAEFSSLSFDPDGKTLATTDRPGGVKLWDLATKQATDMFTNDADQFESVAFSPDGRTLVAAGPVSTESASGVLILLDMNTGQQIGNTITLPSPQTVTFNHAGDELATINGYPGTLQLWNTSYLTDPELSLCQVDGALFTPAEWSAAGTDVPYENVCGQR